jgi:hypothetical protein
LGKQVSHHLSIKDAVVPLNPKYIACGTGLRHKKYEKRIVARLGMNGNLSWGLIVWSASNYIVFGYEADQTIST